MKKNAVKLSAAALAGLMALSMTACGAASTNTTPAGSDTMYNKNQAYRYSPMPDNKSNAKQDVTDMMDDTRRAADNIGEDMKRTAKDATGTMKNAYEKALENGTLKSDTRAKLPSKKSNANTGSGAGATYGNGASGSTQNTTNAGVSMSGVR